jgi:hypothetical protein
MLASLSVPTVARQQAFDICGVGLLARGDGGDQFAVAGNGRLGPLLLEAQELLEKGNGAHGFNPF